MQYRQTVLRKDFSIASDGTHLFDLTGQDPISRVTINPKVTNPNAYVAVGHPLEVIEKIEIVDGSDVLVSLEGTQAVALAYYSARKVPVSTLNYMALQWAFTPIEIYFGRYLFDEEMVLDPKRFNNLQIKVTTNIDASMTAAAAGYIDIVLDCFDEKDVSPIGFLESQEIVALDTVASAVEYVDLPTDFPIRILMGHCFSDTQAPEYNVASFELYEAQRKKLLISYDMEDYQSIMQSLFPLFVEKIMGQALTTDRNFWISAPFERCVVLNDYSEANSVLTPESTGGQKLILSAEANANFEGHCSGHAPHGSTPFVFPYNDKPENYWNVSRGGSGTLKVTFHASVDTTPTYDVITQQLRLY